MKLNIKLEFSGQDRCNFLFIFIVEWTQQSAIYYFGLISQSNAIHLINLLQHLQIIWPKQP